MLCIQGWQLLRSRAQACTDQHSLGPVTQPKILNYIKCCFFLVALPLVFCGDNNSIVDRVAELLEARHPKLSGTGLVKQIVQAIGSDQLQGPCVQACGLVKDDDEHIDCSTACHVIS
ncbi:hypothetical protein V1264_006346 [Littorina saxatilis]|uniref:Uncharacterized protein n=1 Tax=Littorina saxatilis TaxID=31220 RepID=A0AAN9AYQ7_9CAEN